MSKYIDVESLINSLEKCQFDIEHSIYGKGFGKATETMLGILRKYPRANVAPIADTVRKMQEEINKTLSALCKGDVSEIRRMIDQIAKEMLEDNNEKTHSD